MCVCEWGGRWLGAEVPPAAPRVAVTGPSTPALRSLYCRASPPPYRLQYIRFLTQTKAYSQILGRIFAGQRKNRFVQEE